MSNQRNRIFAELDIQARQEGETSNITSCRIIARHAKTNQELQALLSIQHHRYGKLSYETHRFYYVRQWVGPLVAELGGENRV